MSDPARLVVLVSGSGSLLQALLDTAELPARIVAVGADRHGVEGLARAERAAIATFVTRAKDFPDRAAWDTALTEQVGAFEPDLVISAGFMKILGPTFLERFTAINTHPALLPACPGAHAVRDALAYGVTVTGSTVHIVDAGLDTGPVIAQRPVPVEPDDDEATLHERIKGVERELLVETVTRMICENCSVAGRKVIFS